MKTRFPFAKRLTVSTLALALALGGATSAFADGDHGHDKGKDSKFKGRTNITINLNFKDLDEREFSWAMEHIASLAARGVFKGFEDGTFHPSQAISRVEAITAAVRLMGLESTAQAEMTSNLNFQDAEKIQEKYPWAVGYVAVAMEHDLFGESETKMNPDASADRLWSTILLVKALGLDAEAKAHMNDHLTFKDEDKIPAGAVGYVAVAVQKGLVKGYENNTFRPNQPVTRAELAVLLNRTGNQMPEQQDPESNVQALTGKIAVINGTTILLQQGDKTTPLVVDPSAFVYSQGVKTTLASLKAGDEITARTYNGSVIFIEVKKPAEEQATVVSGKFQSYTLAQTGRLGTISVTTAVYNGATPELRIYNVADNVTIDGNMALLVPNRDVDLTVKSQQVTNIKIK